MQRANHARHVSDMLNRVPQAIHWSLMTQEYTSLLAS